MSPFDDGDFSLASRLWFGSHGRRRKQPAQA